MKTNNKDVVFDTGLILRTYCENKRIYKAALSRKMGINYGAMLKNLKAKDLHINRLVEFSHGLEHNFVMDIAMQLPAEYKTNAAIDTTKDERIAALEQEVALLKAKNEMLVELMKEK